MEHVIAIDVGATNTRVALVTGEGTIRSSVSSSTPSQGHSSDIIASDLIMKINGLLDDAGEISVSGIGISAAGPVDLLAGAIVNPPNMRIRLYRSFSLFVIRLVSRYIWSMTAMQGFSGNTPTGVAVTPKTSCISPFQPV